MTPFTITTVSGRVFYVAAENRIHAIRRLRETFDGASRSHAPCRERIKSVELDDGKREVLVVENWQKATGR